MKYWARIGDRSLGPFSLKQLHAIPGFSPQTLICPLGGSEWKAAGELEGVKALFEAKTPEELDLLFMSPKQRRRIETRRKRMEEKESFKKFQRAEAEKDRAEQMKAIAAADKGINPIPIVLALVAATVGAVLWMQRAPREKPQPESTAQGEAHPARTKHWSFLLIGKSEKEILKQFKAEPSAVSAPDDSERFQESGELARWSRHERVLELRPAKEFPYGEAEGSIAVGFRGGTARGAGRRFSSEDPAELPKIADVLPASFASDLNLAKQGEGWRLKWEIGKESWGASVLENPASAGDMRDWRVKEFWLTTAE